MSRIATAGVLIFCFVIPFSCTSGNKQNQTDRVATPAVALFEKHFMDDYWKTNLPMNSTAAIAEHFRVVGEVDYKENKLDGDFVTRYGFTKKILVRKGSTEIEYLENETTSTVWSFSSSEEDLRIRGFKVINIGLEDLFSFFGRTEDVTESRVQYEHKDFSFTIDHIGDKTQRIQFSRLI